MTILDSPLERRLSTIESDLGGIKTDLAGMKTDLAIIRTRLEAVPSRWLQFVFAISILVPIYGILIALLWQVLKTG